MSDERPEERELKFPCADLDAVRSRLVELEAERVSASAREDNLVFDRDGELEKSQKLLRLRTDRNGSRLTFKGPAHFEGSVKVRREDETPVEDPKVIRRILENLGYEVVRRYQKFREEWRLGGIVAALDHTPIGDFAEFEGEGAERLARRCGFELEQAERRNYLRLYSDYRREHPESPDDMVFP